MSIQFAQGGITKSREIIRNPNYGFFADFSTGIQDCPLTALDVGSTTKFDSVTNVSNIKTTYDSSVLAPQMSFMAKIVNSSAGSGQGYATWNSDTLDQMTDHWGRAYIHLSSTSAGANWIFAQWQSGSTQIGLLRFNNTTKVIEYANGTGNGTVVASTVSTLSANTIYRLNWHFVNDTSAGSFSATLYDVTNGVTVETFSATGLNTLAYCDQFKFLMPLSSSINTTVILRMGAVAEGCTQDPGVYTGKPHPLALFQNAAGTKTFSQINNNGEFELFNQDVFNTSQKSHGQYQVGDRMLYEDRKGNIVFGPSKLIGNPMSANSGSNNPEGMWSTQNNRMLLSQGLTFASINDPADINFQRFFSRNYAENGTQGSTTINSTTFTIGSTDAANYPFTALAKGKKINIGYTATVDSPDGSGYTLHHSSSTDVQVDDTTGFAASGTFTAIDETDGVTTITVTYTSLDSITFIGCTVSSGNDGAILSDGDALSGPSNTSFKITRVNGPTSVELDTMQSSTQSNLSWNLPSGFFPSYMASASKNTIVGEIRTTPTVSAFIRSGTDAVTTSGSKTVTSATAAFTSADKNRSIMFNNDAARIYLINTVNSATQITLSANDTVTDATGTQPWAITGSQNDGGATKGGPLGTEIVSLMAATPPAKWSSNSKVMTAPMDMLFKVMPNKLISSGDSPDLVMALRSGASTPTVTTPPAVEILQRLRFGDSTKTGHTNSVRDAEMYRSASGQITTNAGILPAWYSNLTDFFDIRAYGALTTANDNSTAINNAISAANAAGGGIVYVPTGAWKITNSIVLLSNVTLRGAADSSVADTASTIKMTATAKDALLCTNTTTSNTNITVENIRIQGPTTNSGNGIYLQNTGSGGVYPPFTYFSFRDLYIRGFNGSGKWAFNGEEAILTKFERVIAETNANGFFLNGTAHGGYSTACTSTVFDTCYANGIDGVGFKADHSSYIDYIGCAADSCGTAYNFVTCGVITFNGCGMEWGDPDGVSPGDGIKIDGCHRLNINGGYNYQNKHYALWVTGSSTGVNVTGFEENTPGSAAVHGYVIDSGSDVTMMGCSFESASNTNSGTLTILNDTSQNSTFPKALATGGFARAITAKTADYTLTTSDAGASVDASSGNVTITLPAPSGTKNGQEFIVKKTDNSANTVTVSSNAGIDGSTTYILYSYGDSVTVSSNLSAYRVIDFGLVGRKPQTDFNYFTNAASVSTGETTLYSDDTPANTFVTNGDKLYFEYSGVTVASATATREWKVYFGGTSIFDSTALTINATASWRVKGTIIKDTTTSVRTATEMVVNGLTTEVYTSVTSVTGLTFTSANTLKITGQSGGAGAADGDIVAQMGYTRFDPSRNSGHMTSYLLGHVTTSADRNNPAYTTINPSGVTNWGSGESLKLTVVPCAVTLSNLQMTQATAPGTGKNYVYTVRKNSASTSLAATIADSATTGSDTTHSVDFVAGDTISLLETPSGTPALSGNVDWSIKMSAAGNTYPVLGGVLSPASASATQYAGIMGANNSSSGWDTTESNASIVCPIAGTLSKFYLVADTSPGSAKSYDLTLMKNGSASSVTVNIAGSATTASDLVNSVSVSAGDTLSVKCVPNSTPSGLPRFGWGFVFTPTNNGESFYGFGTSNASSTTQTQYEGLVGIGGTSWNATESNRSQIMPTISTFKSMYAKIGTDPGGAASRAITLRKNSADTAITVTINSGSTTGNITGQAITFTQGDTADYKTVPTSTPAANTGGFHIGLGVFISPYI